MPGVTNGEREIMPRKTVIIFFIIDTSGSMAGTRIGAVSSALEETLEKLREMNANNTLVEIKVALLEFSNSANWLTPIGPVYPENYIWTDLNAEGMTAMDEAFRLLEEKLHISSGFMKEASGSYAPVLFLMTDAEPSTDYTAQLANLKKNKWFIVSTKIALSIGDENNDHILEDFTGSKEAVVRVPSGNNAGAKLAKMINFLAVNTLDIVTQQGNDNPKTKQEQVEDAIQEAVSDDDFFDVGGNGFDF